MDHVWNEENRLVLIESAAGVPASARMREEWTYLPDGRWIERIVSTNNGSTYYPAGTNRYVWDGQVLLAMLDHTNGLVMSFVRGLDLSDTIQGAGGVGGVLAVTFKTNGTHFVCYDGNGNVTALTDASSGANSAVFEYGPFGEPLRVTGSAAVAMPLRFSTMYEDDVTGDRKYLFREYRPSLGRWLSRDPLGEHLTPFSSDTILSVSPLYAFCLNDPTDSSDYLGLACWVWFKCVLSGQQSKGIMKSCVYNCVENTSKQRETRAPGMTSCEDLESKLPKPMTTTKIDTVNRCAKCNATMDKVEAFDESWNPITDCSRSKCLQDLANTVKALKVTCALLKGPPRVACNATVLAIEAAGRTACDLCKKP